MDAEVKVDINKESTTHKKTQNVWKKKMGICTDMNKRIIQGNTWKWTRGKWSSQVQSEPPWLFSYGMPWAWRSHAPGGWGKEEIRQSWARRWCHPPPQPPQLSSPWFWFATPTIAAAWSFWRTVSRNSGTRKGPTFVIRQTDPAGESSMYAATCRPKIRVSKRPQSEHYTILPEMRNPPNLIARTFDREFLANWTNVSFSVLGSLSGPSFIAFVI